jgi:hemoglobin/transferrin/lactoferrin receptor protein
MGMARRRASALACGAAIAVIANVGFAQDQNGSETTPSNEKQGRLTLLQRIVLGAGVGKVAIDTPQAVSVVDQEQLDERMATSAGDIFDEVPGVNASGSERVLGETFNIRGVGAPESAGDEGRIIVNVDGVGKFYESYRMGSFFSDPELYKRVEVLRGPASSTLYGSGALGGVINFTTKDASDFLAEGQKGALRLKSTYDSNPGSWLASAIIALRPDENSEFLFAGNYRDIGNYESGDGTEFGTEAKAPSGLAKGTFRFGEANEQILRVSYQHWTSPSEDQPYAQVTTTPAFGTVDRTVTDRTAIIAYENPVTDNEWINLKTQLSYSDTTNEQSGATGVGSTLFNDATYGYQTWQFSAQNTFDHSGENWENHFTFGLQAARQNRSVETVEQFGFHPQGVDTRLGLYAQNEFVWNDKLTLIPGLRVDLRRLSPDGSLTGAEEVTATGISPKLAAHYKLNENFAVFGSYAHTERLPTLDEIFSDDFASPVVDNYSLGLKKERSDNFEIGASASATDVFTGGDTLQVKGTVFHNNIKDYIERFRNLDPQYRNTGLALLYGAEVELAYESDRWFANASYSIIRGENKTPISATNPNSYLNTVAPDELTFTIGHRIPDQGVKFGWKSRFVAEQDRVVGTATARLATDSFSTHSIFASWKPVEGQVLAGFELNASVENLFNTQYKEYLANDPAPGRTFKVSLAKHIGW